MIGREGRSWVLYTRDGSRVLGRHPTREAALRQERAILARKGGSMPKSGSLRAAEMLALSLSKAAGRESKALQEENVRLLFSGSESPNLLQGAQGKALLGRVRRAVQDPLQRDLLKEERKLIRQHPVLVGGSVVGDRSKTYTGARFLTNPAVAAVPGALLGGVAGHIAAQQAGAGDVVRSLAPVGGVFLGGLATSALAKALRQRHAEKVREKMDEASRLMEASLSGEIGPSLSKTSQSAASAWERAKEEEKALRERFTGRDGRGLLAKLHGRALLGRIRHPDWELLDREKELLRKFPETESEVSAGEPTRTYRLERFLTNPAVAAMPGAAIGGLTSRLISRQLGATGPTQDAVSYGSAFLGGLATTALAKALRQRHARKLLREREEEDRLLRAQLGLPLVAKSASSVERSVPHFLDALSGMDKTAFFGALLRALGLGAAEKAAPVVARSLSDVIPEVSSSIPSRVAYRMPSEVLLTPDALYRQTQQVLKTAPASKVLEIDQAYEALRRQMRPPPALTMGPVDPAALVVAEQRDLLRPMLVRQRLRQYGFSQAEIDAMIPPRPLEIRRPTSVLSQARLGATVPDIPAAPRGAVQRSVPRRLESRRTTSVIPAALRGAVQKPVLPTVREVF